MPFSLSAEEASEQLHTVLQHLPQLVWLKDTQGAYLVCNPSFAKFSGIPAASAIGKTDHDLFPRALADVYRADDLRCMQGVAAQVQNLWVNAVDGTRHSLLEISKIPMRDKQGKVSGVLGIGRDITQIKHAARHQRAQSQRAAA